MGGAGARTRRRRPGSRSRSCGGRCTNGCWPRPAGWRWPRCRRRSGPACGRWPARAWCASRPAARTSRHGPLEQPPAAEPAPGGGAAGAVGGALGQRLRRLRAAGGDRLGQDRGLPAPDRRGPAARAGGAGAGAGDRADPAAGGALPGALRRRRGGAAQRAAAGRSGGRPGAGCGPGRWASRSAPARRCSRRCARLGVVVVDEEHDSLVQAGGGAALQRARPGAGARPEGRGGGGAGVGHALARDAIATSSRAATSGCCCPPGPTRRRPPARCRRWRSSICAAQPPMADGLFSPPLLAGDAGHAGRGRAEPSCSSTAAGFSPLVLCRACGHVLRCTQCAVAMTFHRARDRLACHYCGRDEPLPPAVPGLPLAQAGAAGHRHRAGREPGARALPHRPGGPPGPRQRRRPRRGGARAGAGPGARAARSTSWWAPRW